MELTKEYFDKVISGLTTKEYFEEKLKNLATKQHVLNLDYRMNGLEEVLSELNVRVKSIELNMKDVKEKVTRVDSRDFEDSDALNKVFVNHDFRIRVIEKNLKIKNGKTA